MEREELVAALWKGLIWLRACLPLQVLLTTCRFNLPHTLRHVGLKAKCMVDMQHWVVGIRIAFAWDRSRLFTAGVGCTPRSRSRILSRLLC